MAKNRIHVYREYNKELYECVRNLCGQEAKKAYEIGSRKIVGELKDIESEKIMKIGKIYHKDGKIIFSPINEKYYLNLCCDEELGYILIEIERDGKERIVEENESFIPIPEEAQQTLIHGLESKHYKRTLSKIVELKGKKFRVFI